MADKEFKIIVNATEHTWPIHKISFEDVIKLAFGSYTDNELIVYSVTYKKGEEKRHEGTLTKGDEVPVKDGMIFNATLTDRS